MDHSCVLLYCFHSRQDLQLQSNASYQVATSAVCIHTDTRTTSQALWVTNTNKEITPNYADFNNPDHYETAKYATLKGESEGIYSSVYELDGLEDMHSYEEHNVPRRVTRSGEGDGW